MQRRIFNFNFNSLHWFWSVYVGDANSTEICMRHNVTEQMAETSQGSCRGELQQFPPHGLGIQSTSKVHMDDIR
jgi:hypothetical protein